MGEPNTIALNCPTCGGGIRVKENDRTVTCSHCGSEHFLTGIKGTVRSIIPFSLNRADARKEVFRHFRRRDTAQDIPQQGQLKEMTRIYVPFWRVREGYCGWRFRPGVRPQALKRVAEMTVPACSTGGLGFTSVHMESDDLTEQELYEPEKAQREATVYDVTIPEEDILGLTRRRVLGKTEGKGSSSIFFQRIKRISTSASLVYFPFWLVKYSYKGKLYQVVVNGRRGLIVSGRFPVNLAARLGPLVIASALGGFLATSIVSVVTMRSEPYYDPTLPLVGAGIIVVGLVVFIQLFQRGLAALRYGREVRIEDSRRIDTLPEYAAMLEDIRGIFRQLAHEWYASYAERDWRQSRRPFGL